MLDEIYSTYIYIYIHDRIYSTENQGAISYEVFYSSRGILNMSVKNLQISRIFKKILENIDLVVQYWGG